MPLDDPWLRAQRPRLVRLCARLTGDPDAADDLAQETLVRIWRVAERLDPGRPAAPYADAIARNLCRRHLRAARPPAELTAEIALPDPATHALETWERERLLALLDDALAALPAATRDALLARYADDAPPPVGDAAAQRLSRGRKALRRLLAVRDDAEPETDLWCPLCGRARLTGGLDDGRLALRCPRCFPVARSWFVRIDDPSLAGARTLRPAVRRAFASSGRYWRAALADGGATCRGCGRPTPLVRGEAPHGGAPGRPALIVHCRACGHLAWNFADGLAFGLPAVERFWRRHGRIRCQVVDSPASGVLTVTFHALRHPAALRIALDNARFDTLDLAEGETAPCSTTP